MSDKINGYAIYDNLPPLAKAIVVAILKKSIIRFKYESNTSAKEGERSVEPYLLGVNEQENLYMSGFSLDSLNAGEPEEKCHKNYLLQNIDESSFTITDDTFDKLRIAPEKVYKTKKVVVLHAVYFKELIRYILKKKAGKKKAK